jgi:hypothetical protein
VFVGVCLELPYTATLQTISIFRFYSASKKYTVLQCHCATGHNLEEDISAMRVRPGQSNSPYGGAKGAYIGNREMSDKSINGL